MRIKTVIELYGLVSRYVNIIIYVLVYPTQKLGPILYQLFAVFFVLNISPLLIERWFL